MKTHIFIASPIGRLLLVAERGALTAVYHEAHDPPPIPSAVGVPFATISGQRTVSSAPAGPVGKGLGAKELSDNGATVASLKAEAATFERASEQFCAYFAGQRRAFSLPVHAAGTDFQQRVWAAVLDIPYGETRSYKELAAQLGNPSMGRAVGAAIRVNPLAIIIPGHRVVRSTGGITGYSAGPETKRFLLDLEAGDAIRPAA
ncbi:methylated-DNA--[protein]-cysteine S-methyltransferase [Arthrobacter sp. H20]|uniref:methylated-DNA--[protein]-cysteine S-methyltransferase n=1 Tax=Arthrobacter sp. H20 TaxID=1267981 RepID=UPI0004B6783B|nr:methylated-DNA--[protein]-cysteine S-methyltransferase [Arthrobacter sp. H20]